MKTDVKGLSTCRPGEERYEHYYSPALKGWRIQYDYRSEDGTLFSTIARNLTEAREKRDEWLKTGKHQSLTK